MHDVIDVNITFNTIKNVSQIKSIFAFCFVSTKRKILLMYTELFEMYGENVITIKTCTNWFKWFKSNEFEISDKEQSGHPATVKKDELRYYSVFFIVIKFQKIGKNFCIDLIQMHVIMCHYGIMTDFKKIFVWIENYNCLMKSIHYNYFAILLLI